VRLAFSCLLTRDKASKLKRRAPRKHVLPTLFYGNGGTKFLLTEAFYHTGFLPTFDASRFGELATTPSLWLISVSLDTEAALVIAVCHLRCGPARFKLCAHFLKASSKRFSLFFQLLNSQVLFEELVEQHRVHRLVAHTVRLAFVIASNQIGIHLFDFLGH